MYSLENALEVLDELEKSHKIVSDSVKGIFQDKAIPVDERWQIFAKAVEGRVFCEQHFYLLDFKFMDKHGWTSWYDDFNLDRYQTQCLVELVDNIIEMWWGDKSMRFVDNKWVSVLTDQEFDEMIKDDLDEVKEEILQGGYSSFIMDW